MNEEELKALVSRVTASVIAEVNKAEVERGMSVSQLSEQAKLLGGGNLNQAWKITYDTSSNLTSKPDVAAWKITYDTSSIVLDRPQRDTPLG